MPFGGIKASGYGRFGGKAGIEEFTDLRWVTFQLGLRHYPIQVRKWHRGRRGRLGPYLRERG